MRHVVGLVVQVMPTYLLIVTIFPSCMGDRCCNSTEYVQLNANELVRDVKWGNMVCTVV